MALRDDVDKMVGEWLKQTPAGLSALTEGPQAVDPEAMERVLALRETMLTAAEEMERVMPGPPPVAP